MSEKRKTGRGFSLFGWWGTTEQPSQPPSQPTTPRETEQVNQVIDVETIRAAVSMRKLWSTYHDLGDKKQVELLDEVVKLFVKCITTCENDLFGNA
jgi:hypothetical protein